MTSTARAPHFLARFTCLGSDCEDTCCKGWNMQVDPPTLERYRATPALMDSVTGEGENTVMKRDAKTDYCVRFDGGLCGIQREHGAQLLGDACFLYPRATRSLGGEISMTATLSCPEIARLSLFSDDAFGDSSVAAERLPQSLHDYLPQGLSAEEANAIHRAFLEAALREDSTPERNFMRLFSTAQSFSRITTAAWPGAASFYLQHADTALPAPEPKPTDPAFLLQALCGLVAAAKYVHHTRLMQTIRDMEQALHITIRLDTLALAALPDSVHATEAMHMRWKNEWQQEFAPLLRRYLAMQVSLALMPFAGFGHTLPERAAVIGIRFATVRLALMSLCQLHGGTPAQKDIVRSVQSISRFLDHLGSADFSLKIYEETGWLKGGRLRGLLEI